MPLGCSVDLQQEENQTDDESERCNSEQAPDEPIQRRRKHDFKKERSDHRTHQEGRYRPRGDRDAREVPPPLQGRQLAIQRLAIIRGGGRTFSECSTSIDDSGQPPRHDAQHPRYSGKQEDGRQRKLNRVRDTANVVR